MSDAREALQQWVDRVRSLGTDTSEFTEIVAEKLQKGIEANIAAGTDPGGNAWQPTKKGVAPLRNAAKALSVQATGNAVVATLRGPEALHHLGAAKGHIRRQILPTRKIPDSAVKAIETAWPEWCAEKLK